MIDPHVQIVIVTWIGISFLVFVWAVKRDLLERREAKDRRFFDSVAESRQFAAFVKRMAYNMQKGFAKNLLMPAGLRDKVVFEVMPKATEELHHGNVDDKWPRFIWKYRPANIGFYREITIEPDVAKKVLADVYDGSPDAADDDNWIMR